MKKNNLANNKSRMEFYKKVSRHCKAYKDFFKMSAPVKKWSDIAISDKDTYFRKYSLEEKFFDDLELPDFYMVCTSSGSTGEPTLWPRDLQSDDLSEKGHTAYLNEHFNLLTKKTLIVISFGMGTSTAGLIHSQLSWKANKRGKVTTITPGTDVPLTIYLIEKLYRNYEQVIFIGYPPLIEEVLKQAQNKKIDIQKWNVHVATAGAGMTAGWRKKISESISDDKNRLERIVSFYGCTETGMVGMETKETNQIINICIQDKAVNEKLFGTKNLPSLVELNVPGKYVEIVNDEVILSVDQPIPLIRYNIHDKAAFLDFKKAAVILAESGYDLSFKDMSKKMLVIFGRNEIGNFTVDQIKHGLDLIDNEALSQEFQFKESSQNNKTVLELVLYYQNDLSEIDKKSILKDLQKQLSLFHPVKLKVKWKDSSKKIGFKSGKLRYYL